MDIQAVFLRRRQQAGKIRVKLENASTVYTRTSNVYLIWITDHPGKDGGFHRVYKLASNLVEVNIQKRRHFTVWRSFDWNLQLPDATAPAETRVPNMTLIQQLHT